MGRHYAFGQRDEVVRRNECDRLDSVHRNGYAPEPYVAVHNALVGSYIYAAVICRDEPVAFIAGKSVIGVWCRFWQRFVIAHMELFAHQIINVQRAELMTAGPVYVMY